MVIKSEVVSECVVCCVEIVGVGRVLGCQRTNPFTKGVIGGFCDLRKLRTSASVVFKSDATWESENPCRFAVNMREGEFGERGDGARRVDDVFDLV